MHKQQQSKTGKGFFIRDNGRYPPQVRSILTTIGENPVISVVLVKTPLDKVAQAFSSALTFENFNKIYKKIL